MSWVSDEFIEMVISEDPICLFKETAMASEIRASRKALAIAREALEFYHDEGNYTCDNDGYELATAYTNNRLGGKARKALSKIDEVMVNEDHHPILCSCNECIERYGLK